MTAAPEAIGAAVCCLPVVFLDKNYAIYIKKTQNNKTQLSKMLYRNMISIHVTHEMQL